MTVIAHVGGFPVEETLAMFGPALLLALGAASASLRARLRGPRSGRDSDRAAHETTRGA
jgi:hypothetical protein